MNPPWEELDALANPLTDGEREVLVFFDTHLPEGWEIYAQAHLNGLRPDVVLLHPNHGIAVFEVKDWDLGAMDYRYGGSPPVLTASNGNTRFKTRDPIAQVVTYKRELVHLYCPSMDSKAHYGCVTSGVIFTRASQALVDRVFTPEKVSQVGFDMRHKQQVLLGREALEEDDLSKVFPCFNRRRGAHFHLDVAAEELRPWLVFPDYALEQGRPLGLDKRQRELVTTRTQSGYRRIKGAAGSGKSLVLAARAAELASQGKKVLLVSFNITLVNYLRDLAVRWKRGRFLRDNITWINYHAWAKRVCLSNGYDAEYRALWQGGEEDCFEGVNEEVLNDGLAALVDTILADSNAQYARDYDAVLVDEGQDFRLSWWTNLRKAVKDNGERILVADPTQDLYERARNWTEGAMLGAGFSGDWVTLSQSYRMPPDLIPHVRRFAEHFLPNDEYRVLPEPVQGELAMEPVSMRWLQVSPEETLDTVEREILRLPKVLDPATFSWTDVVFLTGSKRLGLDLVERLESQGIHPKHTFYEDWLQERNSKVAFFKGAPGIKATTTHSFKGWEGSTLVVHLSGLIGPAGFAAAYAALTRLKRRVEGSSITIVCDSEHAAEYGATWPEYCS